MAPPSSTMTPSALQGRLDGGPGSGLCQDGIGHGSPYWWGFYEGRAHNSLSTTINVEVIKDVEISQLNNKNGKNQF